MQTSLIWACLATGVVAGDVTVAVASNFMTTAQKIADGFTARTGHTVRIVNGSTGALYAQISLGAPYDVFLSADQARVQQLAEDGRLLERAHKPYALGRLVLYARTAGILKDDIATSLAPVGLHHFAIADPELAPYGRAAFEVLNHLNLTDLIDQKAVLGANISQTFGFIQTGNAPVGFVALSQALSFGGDWQDIAPHLHSPIIQEAGLLANAKDNPAAKSFYDNLSRQDALQILTASGYEVPK